MHRSGNEIIGSIIEAHVFVTSGKSEKINQTYIIHIK